MKHIIYFFLLPFFAFAQSDTTVKVMVRPAYANYRQHNPIRHGTNEQFLMQEMSYEGAIFDTINVIFIIRKAFWDAKYVPAKWEKVRKKLVIKTVVAGKAKKQKIRYEYDNLVAIARFDSVFVPALTLKKQRYTVRIQGDTTKAQIPATYGTIMKAPIYGTLEDFSKIEIPAEYKTFKIIKCRNK